MYTKARFFKCALQVNPASYLAYRGQEQTLTEEEYNNLLLESALECGVEVIGLADHGSVDSIDNIRTLFSDNGIVVFPGFEISSSEKVHFVCLFDEEKTSQELERILGRLDLLDPEDGVLPTNLTALQLIDKITEIGGFIYAAHSTNESGVLKRRMNHIWKHKGLLAAQIPGPVEDLKSVDGDFYRKVFLNKDDNYYRDRGMAAINAADVSKPDEIKNDSASCLIKMTLPCFASFKQAFLDPSSRVRLNSDAPKNYASAISRIRFVGGYLDGLDIEPSEHLNAVIGGRGTGKTTLLESIRFCLELEPLGESARHQHDIILKNNLGHEKGLVEITLRSAVMHGREFQVSRKWGDQAVVVDDSGTVSPHLPTELLPGLEIYGQNEIYEMTKDPLSRNKLIERFLEGKQDEYDEKILDALSRLKENREALLRAFAKKSEIESDVERLPKLQDQSKQFTDLGLDEKLKIVPKLEKEKQLNDSIVSELRGVVEAKEFIIKKQPNIGLFDDANIAGLPDSENLKKQRGILEKVNRALSSVVTQLDEEIVDAQDKLAPLRKELLDSVEKEEAVIEKAFKEIPASQGKTGTQIGLEYQALLKEIEKIRPKQKMMQSCQIKARAKSKTIIAERR